MTRAENASSDLNSRMPRSEAGEIYGMIKQRGERLAAVTLRSSPECLTLRLHSQPSTLILTLLWKSWDHTAGMYSLVSCDTLEYIADAFGRRKETCGDIDILITRDPTRDGKTHAGASPLLPFLSGSACAHCVHSYG